MFRQALLQPVNMIFALGAGLSLWQVLQIWNTTIPVAGATMLGIVAIASVSFHLQLRSGIRPVTAGSTSLGFLLLGCILIGSSFSMTSGMALAFCMAALGIVTCVGSMAYEASQCIAQEAVAASTQSTQGPVAIDDTNAESNFEERLLMKLNVPEARDDEIVLQSWTRTVSNGHEQVEGHLTVDFPLDQRVVHVHIPFTPAFSGDIQAWCECEDGEITGEVESAHRYGMRVRVRRGGSNAAEMSTTLHFVVIESQSSISDVA